MMRWKLQDYLEQHGLNAHQLVQHSGLSTATIYPMTRGELQRVDLRTLERVVAALRDMTQEPVGVSDLLEYQGGEHSAKEDVARLLAAASRSTPTLPGGGKPRGSSVKALGNVAEAVVEDREAQERTL